MTASRATLGTLHWEWCPRSDENDAAAWTGIPDLAGPAFGTRLRLGGDGRMTDAIDQRHARTYETRYSANPAPRPFIASHARRVKPTSAPPS